MKWQPDRPSMLFGMLMGVCIGAALAAADPPATSAPKEGASADFDSVPLVESPVILKGE